MNPLRPLLFLTYRSVHNGLVRALRSPRRLFTLVAVVAYYFLIFVRPAFIRGDAPPLPRGMAGQLAFPPLEVIDALTFGCFMALSLFMLMGIMGYQGGFRPADVDVLFPTPISPKVVLAFRMMRDYLVTLVVPFLLLIFGLRPARMGWEAIFDKMPNPQYSGLTMKAMTLSWILMAMGWVAVGYAVSLYVNRTDPNAEKRRRVAIVVLVALIGFILTYITFSAIQVKSAADLLAAAQAPLLRGIFFNASFATLLTMAPFQGSLPMALLGAGGLVAVVVAGIWASMAQVNFMYDQAAVRGFKSGKSREMQRSGDFMGLMAERAREGKFRVKRASWIHRLRWSGPLALLWKDLLLQPRSMGGILILSTLMGVFMSVVPALAGGDDDIGPGYLLMVMQGSVLMMFTLGLAQTGFIELLKRVDLQKPLPLSPSTIVFFEVIAKSLIGTLACWLGTLLALILNISLWPFGLACIIVVPFGSLLLSSTVCFFTLLFPDLEDASQRQFRGMLSFLGVALLSLLPVGAFAAVIYFKAPVPLAGLAAGLVCFLLSLGVTVASGALYSTYNASE